MAENGENNKSEAALREERVLEFWKANKIFEKSLEKSAPKGEFVFYEGPPTANAQPALHHLEARAFKDVIPRYKTMRGYHVRRKAGWDTHGLPVELQIEKKLGFQSKKEIEDYGIAKFNQDCKKSVWEYVDLWSKFTERIGFWVDQKNPYVTYHNNYIESVWNIVKKINGQNLLFKDYKVVPWCPRCGTALSSHELAQGYEDVKDLSVYVKFKLLRPSASSLHESAASTYLLAWTTTPWTLPGNVALAVGKDIDYVKIKSGIETYILAKDRLSILIDAYQVLEELKGKDLLGLEYEPLYPFFANTLPESEKSKLPKAYKVYEAGFVSTQDGTGVVHTAVMYGQDDFVLGTEVGLPKHHLVGLDGKFLAGTGLFTGRFVRDEEVAVDVIKDLAHRGLLLKKEKYEHSYPHCWRCKTPLIYYARDSWYIKMSDPKIKEQLISQNREINWEPAHIRDGRFGEWLREVKDWAISRERYWGTPLPVWQCLNCKKTNVIGSIAEMKEKTKKSGNKYLVMRHGEADHNILDMCSSKSDNPHHLTQKGRMQVLENTKELKNKNIDVIISSPFLRAKETAEIVANEIGFNKENIIIDSRIQEYKFGIFNLKSIDDYMKFRKGHEFNMNFEIPEGESLQEAKNRIGEFLYDIDQKYQNKNILIFTHGIFFQNLKPILEGLNRENSSEILRQTFKKTPPAYVESFSMTKLPHNENYELDLHRPYIDEVTLLCDCGGSLMRTKEVMDVWFDSGAMPFAQDHYPFQDKKWVDGPGYPADYISEAIDQTRGWFYTLHAVGVLMGRGKAYKNVICLGHLLDAAGKKMSKSLGNVVDPWIMMEKYGVDTLRLWMYSVNQPGESKNFDEKTVQLLHQQVFGLLYNVLAFYELYRDKNLEKNDRPKSKNILDKWILARLDELIDECTEKMDEYKILEPVRAIRDFVGDLSTWYLRRSRERIKERDKDAKQTLYYVLKTLSKLLAPFAPFAAEDIWLKLRNENDAESVHLENWPKVRKSVFVFFQKKSTIIKDMEIAREIVSTLLKERQQKNIPVRQPLILATGPSVSNMYAEIIKEEVNLKDYQGTGVVDLDTKLTPALKAEGEHREFMRELQDERKKMGLAPGDRMTMSIEKIYKKYKIMPSLQEHMLRVAAVASLICDSINIPVDRESIVNACLLHDMGNIIKFRIGILPEFYEPEGVEYWQEVQNEYIKKYGENEHEATLKIIKELGLSPKIGSLVDQIRFSFTCKHHDSDSLEIKIVHYSDGRVDPHGVVSYEERMKEGKKRYKNHKSTFGAMDEEEREKLVECGREIERQIFAKCKIKPEDINNETVKPIISELKNFVIK